MALAFTMTKGAIEQVVRVLSKDLGQRGITVNAVAPGPVDTPIFRDGKSPHVMRSIANQHPQKKVPFPDEISPIVAFLASEDVSWINGQTIAVDGVSGLECCIHSYRVVLTDTTFLPQGLTV